MEGQWFYAVMHKKILSILALTLSALSANVNAAEQKRTDGPPGSEWGDFSTWDDGQFSVGARFGASILSGGNKSSFLIGGDLDFRPTDLFGGRLTFEQSLQKPRLTLIHLAPLVHQEYSNLTGYLLFGPGISIVNAADTHTKFSFQGGLGGDFMFTERIGFGMIWSYYWIFDVSDAHTISARLSYWF